MEGMELIEYFGDRARALLRDVMVRTFSDPRESIFLTRFGLSLRNAQRKRESHEVEGPFARL